MRRPRRLAALDPLGGLAGDDAGERLGVAVGEFEADLARHRGAECDGPVQAGGGDEAHDELDIQVGVQPPRTRDAARRRRRLAVPGQVEGDQPVRGGDAGIGHQPVELPPIGAGGMQAQQVAAGPRLFVIDLVGRAAGADRDVAAGDRRARRRDAERRMQRRRRRCGMTEREPLADLQHAADDVAVLHEGKLLAADRELRHACQHGEDAMMVPGRGCGEELRPDRSAARRG